MGGRWQKVQHDYQGGPNTGDLALQGTEDQWVVEVLSSRTIKIRPKRQYMKRWRGHIHGMTIKAKRGGPAMPIPFADGTKLLRKVVLPKRDPRPTVSQMVQLSKER